MMNKKSGLRVCFALFVSASAKAESLSPTPGPTTSTCFPYALSPSFADSEVIVNNLGGTGPDFGAAEEIRYSNVGTYGGEPFALVVTVSEGSNYVPHNTGMNGRSGDFGIINVKADTSADFKFQFQDAQNNPLEIKAFYFSFFDLDNGKDNKAQEHLCIDDGSYHSFSTVEPALDIEVEHVNDKTCRGDIGKSTVFSSLKQGFGCDNPKDPLQLEVVTCDAGSPCSAECLQSSKVAAFPISQIDRSVEFFFRDQADWNISVSIGGGVTSGRNFLFAGRSSLSLCPEPTPTPTKEPTNQLAPAPPKESNFDTGACFHGNGTVLLQSGASKHLSELSIGEFIKTYDAKGKFSFAPVTRLPHANNNEPAAFLTLKTETGKEVDITSDHYIPKCDQKFVTAGELVVGDCLLTADGKETLIEISWTEKYGVYTAVTEDKFIVVDGIVASPFSKDSHPEQPELDYEKYRLELERARQPKLDYLSRKVTKLNA